MKVYSPRTSNPSISQSVNKFEKNPRVDSALFVLDSLQGALLRINDDLTRPPSADQEDGLTQSAEQDRISRSPLKWRFFGSCQSVGVHYRIAGRTRAPSQTQDNP